MSASSVEVFDASHPVPLSETAIRQLAVALERATGEATDRLGALTRRISEVSTGEVLEPIDLTQLRSNDLLFASFAATDATGEQRVVALAVFEQRGAVGLVDLLLGGPGIGDQRPLGSLEVEVLSRQLPTIVAPLIAATTMTEEASLSLTPVGDSDVIPLDNRLVRLGLKLVVAEIDVPFALLIPDPERHQPVAIAQHADEVLDLVELELEVSLRPVTVPSSELETLGVGDVVRLDHRTDEPVMGCIDEELVVAASLGRAGDRVAIHIQQLGLES